MSANSLKSPTNDFEVSDSTSSCCLPPLSFYTPVICKAFIRLVPRYYGGINYFLSVTVIVGVTKLIRQADIQKILLSETYFTEKITYSS